MDIATVIFVAFLCVAAFFLTMTVRREFHAKDRQRRERQRATQPPRRRR
jgi:hypothetical protein